MRVLLATLLTGMWLIAAVPTASAAPARCAPAGASITHSDARAQVYSLHGAIYGCDRRTHRVVKLGQTTNCNTAPRVDVLALAGDIVAYGLDRCGVDAGFTTVTVRRLSDGKRLHSYAAVTGSVGPESFESIGSLVVTSSGAVAWIASANSIIGHGSRTEVHANRKLLDSGAGIVSSSLRIHGSTITWRHAGTTRSATL